MASNELNIQQYKKMTETPIPKLILGLAAPTILSMLITSIYNLADTFFVGQISTSASGAVGVVSSLMAIIQALGFTLGHGSGTIISRSLGSRNTKAATRFASTSFFTALAVGVVLALIGLATLPGFMLLLGSTETILPHACAYARPIIIAAPLMISSLVMNNILRYEGKANFAMIGLVTGVRSFPQALRQRCGFRYQARISRPPAASLCGGEPVSSRSVRSGCSLPSLPLPSLLISRS